MINAAPFRQSLSEGVVVLCVAIPTGLTTEKRVHCKVDGPLVLPGQTEIRDFAEVRYLGKCDGSCRTPQPGGILQMFPVGQELTREILRVTPR